MASILIFQREVACSDVRVNVVYPGPLRFERSEQASLIDAKGLRSKITRSHRCIHVRILSGISKFQSNVTGVNLNILVADHAHNLQITEWHSHFQMSLARHLNSHFKIVSWTALDRQITVLSRLLETYLHFPATLPILAS